MHNAQRGMGSELVDVLTRSSAILTKDVALNVSLTLTALLCWLVFRTNVKILALAFVLQMAFVK